VKPSGIVVAVAALGWVLYKRKELGRVEIGFWLIVALGGAIYGTGLVAPPNFEKLFEDIGTTLGKWTYLLVGALAYLETGAFIGLIAPGETTILFGGFVAGQGKISLVVLLAIVWGAALAGDVTSYFLGRHLGREFLVKHGPKVKITEARLEKVEGFFQKYGGSAILLGRFVGLVRAIAPFIAGSSRLPFRRFIVYDIIGTGVWGCGLVILGYVFWQSFDQLLKVAKQGLLGLAVVIVVVVGIVALVRFLRDDERREEARRALDAHAIGRRVILPAGRLGLRLVPSFAAIQLATLAAIGLVGGFTFGALAHAANTDTTLRMDTALTDLANDTQTDSLVSLAKALTWLGSQPVVELLVLATVVFLVGRRIFADSAALVAGTIFTVIASNVAKAAIDRPRPAGALVDTSGSSYPSGHAAYSIAWIAVAVALARALPGIGRRVSLVTVALVVAVVIGGTRVYLQAHYASDVLGGWGLGLACYSLCGLVVVAVAFLRQNAQDTGPQTDQGRRPGRDPSPS
jgi:membrane protein DedA with SNARE-associated domain/membrane-associated phospholipid phosphatase